MNELLDGPLDPVFASTFLYAPRKIIGETKWDQTLAYELQHLDKSPFDGLRTLGELRRVCEFFIYTDSTTYITRARSVAAGAFLKSTYDVWLTVDDDMLVDRDVLSKMIRAVRATHHVVALPYVNRDGKSMTFRKVSGPTRWQAVEGLESVPLRNVDRVGMGCVAFHRELVETLASRVPKFVADDSGKLTIEDRKELADSPELFLEGVEDYSWVGEDFYFSALCEREVAPIEVLLDAPSSHAGKRSMLDSEGRIMIQGVETFEKLDAGLREAETKRHARSAT